MQEFSYSSWLVPFLSIKLANRWSDTFYNLMLYVKKRFKIMWDVLVFGDKHCIKDDPTYKEWRALPMVIVSLLSRAKFGLFCRDFCIANAVMKMVCGLVGESVTGEYKIILNEHFEYELMWFLWLRKNWKDVSEQNIQWYVLYIKRIYFWIYSRLKCNREIF